MATRVKAAAAKKAAPSKTAATKSFQTRVSNMVADPSSVTKEEAIAMMNNISKVLAAPVGPLSAPSTNFTSELNNIDFQKMIGGPLNACVNAQVASSLATVNFIQTVGFADDGSGAKKLVMVDFSHSRTDFDEDGAAQQKEVKITVPLLAMLPIPSLRIEHVIIDFNVKLNSVETSKVESSIGVNAEVSGGFGPVKFKVSASYQRKATTGVEVKKEYALNVNVKAVQDEIPAGLEKILNLLAA